MTTTLVAVNVRRRLATAVLLLAVPVLSSCTVNFGAQTDQVYTPATGVNDRSGQVDVLNALVVSAGTGSGTVIATLVNNDQTRADRLRGITGAGADASVTVTPGGPTAIPAGGLLNLATAGRIVARGPQVVPGGIVTLRFAFDRAKAVTLDVPVVANTGAYADVPVPSSTAGATPSGPPSPSASTSASPSASPSS